MAPGWDDFSDSLATDLAPFLSLFGEQVTKQYLSESVTFLDYFIFAIAPMGILTAVVSAIRVCGSPSLRAFIGRAQEGGGNAEAELCSSTSRDVCELYNNGGIARVFGRPKILEVVVDPATRDFTTHGTAGIYTFQKYVAREGRGNWYRRPRGAKESATAKQREGDSEFLQEIDPPKPAFAPNLSLNIGIKKRHPAVFWLVAVVGFLLQAGVLTFAVVVTYHFEWQQDGRRPDKYACPLVIAGTVIVSCGVFLCAFLVGQSTDEEVWRRRETNDGASIHWMQPGGQIIGDQTFDAFYYADCDSPKDRLHDYTISWKSPQQRGTEPVVWAAVLLTISGFVLQFTGLRGIHSAVSVAQLGAVMVMGVARAGLRMQRLRPDNNAFAKCPDEIIGHELDWLALRIGREDIDDDLDYSPHNTSSMQLRAHRYFWKFCGATGPASRSMPRSLYQRGCGPNVAEKLLAYRARLAHLTKPRKSLSRMVGSAGNFEPQMVAVRLVAQQLALAMESAVNAMFAEGVKVKEEWELAEWMFWSVRCEVSSKQIFGMHQEDQRVEEAGKRHVVRVQLCREITHVYRSGSPWRLQNRLELEGVLGLWLWSLKSDPLTERTDPRSQFTFSRAEEIPTRRIVSADATIAKVDMGLWYPLSLPASTILVNDSREQADQSKIWAVDGRWEYHALPDALPTDSCEGTVRFFGWHAAGLPKESLDVIQVWSVPTEGSLLSQCAQDVFGAFLTSALPVVHDIGGVQIEEEAPHFSLKNNLLSALVTCFTQNQLGSSQDALMCILPAIIPSLNMSSSASALGAAKESAKRNRRQGQWTEAEAVLRWAWTMLTARWPASDATNSDTDLAEQAAISLGELYRYALREPEARHFGIDGIEWLCNQKSISSWRLAASVMVIIDRYHSILKASITAVGTHIGDGLLVAAQEKDITKALMELTRRKPAALEARMTGNALCSAAGEGWSEVVLAILELGIDPNYSSKDASGQTALCFAAQSGSAGTVKELLDWGASPNLEDIRHKTPLLYATEAGHAAVVEQLLSNTHTRLQSDAIHLAALKGHASVMILLLDRCSDINSRDAIGRTPLHIAATEGHDAVVKALLKKRASVELTDRDHYTPLQLAASGGHEAVVDTLLIKAAKINSSNSAGSTPLHLAVTHGHDKVVKLLVERGANLSAKDKDGRTAMQRAEDMGREDIVEMLEDALIRG